MTMYGVPTITKVDEAGNRLPDDAKEWAYTRVRLGEHAFDMLPENVGGRAVTYDKAVAACAALVVLGGGWRLPTRRELQSIVDLTRTAPAVDPTFFPGFASDWYWTSDGYASSPSGGAWLVSFRSGLVDYCDRDYDAFARAVRTVTT